ncbi:MAG TPA: LysR family transcriptional regulator [Telluria sp.]|nr:LysR family transcriptional regulator [Telluria sp.]
MDKLRSMEVFVAVVDAGSFTAAAERLDISPVMVGKHIQELEQRLGSRLLARTTRRQSLTEIGAHYAEQCRAILAQVSAADASAEAMRATPRGRLRITAPVSFGAQWLAPAMTEYLERYPEVTLELELIDHIVDLVDEGFDAAIRIATLDDSTLVARPLWPFKMMIVASPDYLQRHGMPRKPADLVKHRCLDFSHWSKTVRWKLKGMDDDVVIPASRFRCNNGLALKRAALAGFGIIMQAEMMLREDVQAGRLVPLLQGYIPDARDMYLVYPRDRRATPKLTTFINFILTRFGHGTA